jgi:hypothetical protein
VPGGTTTWRGHVYAARTVLGIGDGDRYYVCDGPADCRLSVREIRLERPRNLPSESLALTGARLVTLDGRKVLERGAVVVRRGRIACVGDCDVRGVDRVIDAAGTTIVPGFIDMHAHHSDGQRRPSTSCGRRRSRTGGFRGARWGRISDRVAFSQLSLTSFRHLYRGLPIQENGSNGTDQEGWPMIRWLRWAGVLARSVFAMLAICLVTAPAAADVSEPGMIVRPLTAEQLLVLEAQVPGSEASSGYGFSVSLSDDGLTALVGAPFADCEAGTNCGVVEVLVRSGGTWIEQAQLIASDRAAGAELGTSVALSGDGSIALVGALRADCPTGSQCGAAYVFVRSGSSWTQVQKLFASDADGFDFFGQSVDLSIDGSVALIGATSSTCVNFPSICGAAYVFVRTGGSWIETARLDPSNPMGTENFGLSVSLSDDGTIALIGAPGSDCGGVPCGQAYVFVGSGTTWTEEGKFTDSNPGFFDQFGFAVSLSSDGSVALVGELSDDCTAGSQCGAAYIFERDGGQWTESAKLTIPDNSGDDLFGIRVALAGDALHALIGANALGPCPPGGTCRLAYLFVEEEGLWQEKQRLTATRPCGGGSLSTTVALSENADRALVGAHFSSCPGDPGEAYIFGPAPSPLEIPVVSGAGLAVLAMALAAIGAMMLSRNRTA